MQREPHAQDLRGSLKERFFLLIPLPCSATEQTPKAPSLFGASSAHIPKGLFKSQPRYIGSFPLGNISLLIPAASSVLTEWKDLSSLQPFQPRALGEPFGPLGGSSVPSGSPESEGKLPSLEPRKGPSRSLRRQPRPPSGQRRALDGKRVQEATWVKKSRGGTHTTPPSCLPHSPEDSGFGVAPSLGKESAGPLIRFPGLRGFSPAWPAFCLRPPMQPDSLVGGGDPRDSWAPLSRMSFTQGPFSKSVHCTRGRTHG